MPPSGGTRTAIVLFNLGGPDSPEAIKPFLLNLFRDPAIIRAPAPVRAVLARVIARARLKPATENYALLGGRSPLLELTRQQATALEAAFPDAIVRCFIAMRYWHPFSLETAREVKAWQPDRIVLLPLYPQYSTTTTGSSLTAWRTAAARVGLAAPTTTICCYPNDRGFAAATAALVRRCFEETRTSLDPSVPIRVLFSAHGLPEAIVEAGDPYQWQVVQSVLAVMAAWGEEGIDWRVAYQSRATPQKWIGPSTEEEIERAGHDKVALLIVPIAFVSDHSETLVELDIEYRDLAQRAGVPSYVRVPTQNTDPGFIGALADLVRRALDHGPGLSSHAGARICPVARRNCPWLERM